MISKTKFVHTLFFTLLPLWLVCMLLAKSYFLWVFFDSYPPFEHETRNVFGSLSLPVWLVMFFAALTLYAFFKRLRKTRALLLWLTIVNSLSAALVFFVPFYLYGIWFLNIYYVQTVVIEVIPFILFFLPYVFFSAAGKKSWVN